MEQDDLKSQFARVDKALVAMGARLARLRPLLAELEHVLYDTIITRSKKRRMQSFWQDLQKHQEIVTEETNKMEQTLTDFREAFHVEYQQ